MLGSGPSRIIVVGVSTFSSVAALPGARVTGVTLQPDNLAFTRVDDGLAVSSDGKAGVDLFILKEPLPTAGSYTIQVGLAAGDEYAVGGSVSFSGVNQTTPNRTFAAATNRNTGTSMAPSITTVPSATNEVVVDTVGTAFSNTPPNILAPDSAQTEQWNGKYCDGPPPSNEPDLTFNSIGAGSTKPGSAPTTMLWAQTNSQPWVIEAISLIPLAPTQVELASFEAARTGAGVRLRWQTGFEVNNLGFNLYREVNGKRTRNTPSMVAGSALLAGQDVALTAGRSYTWLDKQGTADAQYWLESVDLDGRRTLHGPILPAARDAGGSVSGESQSPLLDQLNSMTLGGGNTSLAQHEHPASFDGDGARGRSKGGDPLTSKQASQESSSTLGATPQERQRALAAMAAVKLLVNHNGWYRVGQQELVAAGLNPNADPRLLQLYADGAEVPMLVNSISGTQFGPNDSIEFYGMGLNTRWTDTQTYWLIVGSTPGARIRKEKVRRLGRPTANQPGQPSQPVNSPGAGRPDTPAGRPVPQQGSTFFNWMPPLILPSVTPERPSPVTLPTAIPATIPDGPVAAATPNSTTASPETTASTPLTTAASPRTIAEPQPTTIAQPTVSAQPLTRRSANSRRRKRKQAVKRNSGAASRRKKNHATASDSGVGDVAESFSYTIERTERTFYFAALQNGDDDNFFGQLIGADPATLKLNIHHLASSAGQSTLEVTLQGVTTEEHQVNVSLNGVDVGQLSFVGRAHPVTQFAVSNALLHNGENTLILTALRGETDLSLVDSVRVIYPHTYEADNNSLAFSIAGRQGVIVDGFNSSSIRMLDISDPSAVEELVAQSEQQGTGYGVAFEATQGGTLLAMTDSQIEHPAQVVSNQPSSWYNYEPGADLLIVTHRDFLNELAPLTALRQSQGLTVAVIDVEDIYDEFSYGAHSTPALREFFNWTSGHWQRVPRYVLLVGDCSLDPHNYLGQGQFDFVPTRLVDTAQLETASDDSLADFNNDGVPEMAVGRLPVRTAAETMALVGKIVSFQNGNLKRGALLISDRQDGFDFEAANREIRALLPQAMDVQTINRGSNDASTVRSQIINGIDQGPLLVNYLGHGSVEVWTGAGIFRTSDASALTNNQSLSFFVMMTCLNGFAQDVYTQSLAEAVLRSEQGGAVAVWASSGLTGPDQQALMNQQLIRSLFGDQPATIGDAIINAKAATQNMDTRRTWMLLGDPTTRLR